MCDWLFLLVFNIYTKHKKKYVFRTSTHFISKLLYVCLLGQCKLLEHRSLSLELKILKILPTIWTCTRSVSTLLLIFIVIFFYFFLSNCSIYCEQLKLTVVVYSPGGQQSLHCCLTAIQNQLIRCYRNLTE